MTKLWLLPIILLFSSVAGAAAWRDHSFVPDWFRRGGARITLTGLSGLDSSTANHAALGINLYRENIINLDLPRETDRAMGEVMARLRSQGVHEIEYISPMDCFFDGRLKKVIPSISPWFINLFEHWPYLEDAILVNPDGSKRMAYNNPNDRGGNTARYIGDRNDPIWQEFRQKWYSYVVEGPSAVAQYLDFARLPDRSPVHELIDVLFIDNTGTRPCFCDRCWGEFQAFYRDRFGEELPAGKDMGNRIVGQRATDPLFGPYWEHYTNKMADYNRGLTQFFHDRGRLTIMNAGPGQLYATAAQMRMGAADSILWELLYRHAPWGRVGPWYKRGLAAGAGKLTMAVTYCEAPIGLPEDAMPVICPLFTRMALAEALACQGSYCLWRETGGDYAAGVRSLNEFNITNSKLYLGAQPGGRIAVLMALRTGLLFGRGDSDIDSIVNGLMSAGVPVEVITEDELDHNLRERFDVLIAPDLECVTPEIVESVSRFSAEGGGLLVSESFGTLDWNRRPADFAGARALVDAAKRGEERLRLIANYGAGLNGGAFAALVESVTLRGMPQQLEVPSSSDCIVNALSHPDSGLQSFHIVNYDYSANPTTVLRRPSDLLRWEFWNRSGSHQESIWIYGRALKGGCDLSVSLNGRHLMVLKAEQLRDERSHEGFPLEYPRWVRIPLENADLRTVNVLSVRPAEEGEGAFVVYSDVDGGGEPCGTYTIRLQAAQPSSHPLKAVSRPLKHSRLCLRSYPGDDWHAAVLSPDQEATAVAVTREGNDLVLDLPDVDVYSVVVVGQGAEKLAQLIETNNSARRRAREADFHPPALAGSSKSGATDVTDSTDNLLIERLFTMPSGDYMPVPWWAWTGELDPAQLEAQLRLMREQGIREFFIFPIYGMDVEFMSSDYLDRIRFVIDRCKQLGMKVWIYDELSWPSGTAAGLVPRKHPYAVASQLHVERNEKASPADVEALLSDPSVLWVGRVMDDGSLQPLDKGSVPSSEAVHTLCFRRVRDAVTNLTVRGCKWTKNDPGMLDLLSPKAVDAFIEEAYQPVAAAFPDELGRTIRGFFTDEPQFAHAALPWTDGFREKFEARFGYDVVEHLHELIIDSPGCERCRIDFWSLAADLASSSFTGKLADWCAERDMLLTGHMVHEETSHSVTWTGDLPSHLLHMQVPGCDLLTTANNFREPQGWYVYGGKSLIKSIKNPSSAARFTGAKRVMCEAYGVLPWSKTPSDEKCLTDWLCALGVNMINDNSLITDICDFRKRAIAGKHFTQPYWPDEHLYYDYAARVCGITAKTTLDTQLLLLYPTTTWWAGVRGGTDTSPDLRKLEIALDTTADALVRRQWHYEHLYEQVLEAATVRDGALVTSGGEFRAIILAGITHLRPQQARKLEEFAVSGGAVVLAGSDVQVIDGENRRPLRLDPLIELQTDSPSFYDDLDRALGSVLKRPWSISGEGADGIISAARFDDRGGKYLFVANMTPGAKDLLVSWIGELRIEMWDPDTGARWTPEQSHGSVKLVLPEDQSVWLAQTANPGSGTAAPAHFRELGEVTAELVDGWSFAADRPNVFSLTCRIKIDREGTLDARTAAADESWTDLVVGDAGVPLRPEDMDCYWLTSDFELREPIAGLQLVVDTVLVEGAWLDGVSIGPSGPATLWDEHNRAWRIDRCNAGRHSLLLKVRPSPYSAAKIAVFPVSIVEPVVLTGTFSVCTDGALGAPAALIRIGDLGPQGYPSFAGVGVYSNIFAWTGGDAIIDVPAAGSVVEVLVDGTSLGKRAWGNRRFLAESLAPGEHSLEIRVTSTLGGILRRFYGATAVSDIPAYGLLAPVRVGR